MIRASQTNLWVYYFWSIVQLDIEKPIWIAQYIAIRVQRKLDKVIVDYM